jgi:hypothetical protein
MSRAAHPNRQIFISISIRVTEEEKELIDLRQKQLQVKKLATHLRKVVMDDAYKAAA